MFSKFKVTSAPNAYSTHFPLAKVYEAEICRLRNENAFIKQQNNLLLSQLNEVLAQHAPFNASQKAFFELSRAARCNKKKRIRNLILHLLRGLEESVSIEIKVSVQGEEVVVPLGSVEEEDTDPEMLQTTQRVLVAKDSGLISDEAYHELRMSLPEDSRVVLPPINALKDERNRQNKIINIHHITEAKKGDGKEDYEEVQSCLGATLLQEAELQSQGIIVDGVHYTVTWFCCSDWKFLAMIYGLNAATAKYFCIWCYCTKEQVADFSIQHWPIQRDLAESKSLCLEKTTDQKKRCDYSSIRFLNWLLTRKEEVLEAELEKIGVPFKFYEVQSEHGPSTTKWTRLDGKDLHNILDSLNLKPIFDGLPSQGTMTYKNVKKVWKGFADLYAALEAEPGDENYKSPEQFQGQVRNWAKFFKAVHFDEDVTPYIHGSKFKSSRCAAEKILAVNKCKNNSSFRAKTKRLL
ncbi:hypothetical protein ACROYT_G014586 [Oculina patagonica]